MIRHLSWKCQYHRELPFGRLQTTPREVDLTQPDMRLADMMRIGTWKEQHLGIGLNGVVQPAFIPQGVAKPDLSFTPRIRCGGQIF